MSSLNGADFEEHVVLKQPDVVIVQVGIVDCAPRVFSPQMKKVLQSRLFPSLARDALLGWVSAHRAMALSSNPLARVYTKPRDFERELRRFFERVIQAGTIRVAVFPILGDLKRLDEKSPGFSRNIEIYNEIIRGLCEPVSISLIPLVAESAWFGVDAYHLSAYGSEQCANAALKWLRSTDVLRRVPATGLQGSGA